VEFEKIDGVGVELELKFLIRYGVGVELEWLTPGVAHLCSKISIITFKRKSKYLRTDIIIKLFLISADL
jgi:hypothetical protein